MKTNELITKIRSVMHMVAPPARELLEQAADALECRMKWIPVTERLPEDDLPKDTKRLMIRCLVASDKGTVKPCVRQRWQHFDGSLVPWQWNKDLHAKPTHWMPLPEPPKEVTT